VSKEAEEKKETRANKERGYVLSNVDRSLQPSILLCAVTAKTTQLQCYYLKKIIIIIKL
jgi:hypothetical protein